MPRNQDCIRPSFEKCQPKFGGNFTNFFFLLLIRQPEWRGRRQRSWIGASSAPFWSNRVFTHFTMIGFRHDFSQWFVIAWWGILLQGQCPPPKWSIQFIFQFSPAKFYAHPMAWWAPTFQNGRAAHTRTTRRCHSAYAGNWTFGNRTLSSSRCCNDIEPVNANYWCCSRISMTLTPFFNCSVLRLDTFSLFLTRCISSSVKKLPRWTHGLPFWEIA